jgi:hypothetical protein
VRFVSVLDIEAGEYTYRVTGQRRRGEARSLWGLCLSLNEKDLTDLFTTLRMSQKMVKDDVTFVCVGLS